MAKKDLTINQQILKDILHYNQDTGIFTRKLRTSPRSDAGEIAGTITSWGYIQISVNNHLYRAHRLAFMYMTGEFPVEVDHINHNAADNRWSNLRPATSLINSRNMSRRHDNKSGCSGVTWSNSHKKWKVKITVNYEPIHLGVFNSLFDAVAARKSAENNFGFHPNHGEL